MFQGDSGILRKAEGLSQVVPRHIVTARFFGFIGGFWVDLRMHELICSFAFQALISDHNLSSIGFREPPRYLRHVYVSSHYTIWPNSY
jgi:hypothetical protein